MSKPISLAYRGRGGSTAAVPASHPGNVQQSAAIAAGLDRLVKDGLDWSQLEALASVKDVEESFDGFRPVRSATGSFKDKNGTWHRAGAISFISSKMYPVGGKTFTVDSIVEAILPTGCTIDVPVGEDASAGKLTVRHKALAEGEKLFRVPKDADVNELARGHKLTMKPVVSCVLVEFNGLKPYRIEEKRVKLFSETDLARAQELGTLSIDEPEAVDNGENPQG